MPTRWASHGARWISPLGALTRSRCSCNCAFLMRPLAPAGEPLRGRERAYHAGDARGRVYEATMALNL